MQSNSNFDRLAQGYDKWYETPFGSYAHNLEKDLIFDLLGKANKKWILDSGCGTGNYSIELKRYGAIVVGLDSSLEMIKIAKTKALEEDFQIHWILASNGSSPFKDKCFDKSISVTSLEFCEGEVNTVAKEMVRTVRDRVVIGVLNKWSLYFIQKKIIAIFKDSIYKKAHFYNIIELKKIFGDITWKSTLFAPSGTPNMVLNGFLHIEKPFSKLLGPFGAFLAIRKDLEID